MHSDTALCGTPTTHALRTAGHALVAAACACIAAVLAAHHPLWPWGMLALLAAWMLVVFVRLPWSMFAIPALLPFLSLMPWTGWLAVDEFDLLVLGWLAAGHAHAAVAGTGTALGHLAVFRAAAVAVMAIDLGGDLDLLLDAEHGLFEIQVHHVAQVGTAPRLRPTAAALPPRRSPAIECLTRGPLIP